MESMQTAGAWEDDKVCPAPDTASACFEFTADLPSAAISGGTGCTASITTGVCSPACSSGGVNLCDAYDGVADAECTCSTAEDHPMLGREENMDCVCEIWGGKFVDGGVNKKLASFVEHPNDVERFGDSNAEYRVENCGEFNPPPKTTPPNARNFTNPRPPPPTPQARK